MTKNLLRVLKGETVSPAPIWLMRQAGRYLPEYRRIREQAGSFLKLCLTPELAEEITLQPIRRFGFDAAILFSDILIVPYGLGQGLKFVDGEGPKLEPIRSVQTLEALNGSLMEERTAPVFETVCRLRRSLPENVTLIGFAGAPWTVATYMVEGGSSRDFSIVKGWAYRDPLGFQTLIDRIVDASETYLLGQVEAGAEAIQLFDSWAGVLSEGMFRRWVIEPTRELVIRLKRRAPGIPIIGFPRAAGLNLGVYVVGTGLDALSLDTMVPLDAAVAMQQRLPVQGNLDPLALVAGGAALREETAAILAALGKGPLVFNLGHGIVPETPPAHVAELVSLVRGRA
ncbi:MAG: uroporphyrinogen decarboxylase [Alphaproteobacteria bacterium]|nr:uroporphyrinogen decarboxylase [Alphaproteobacteria bacterium]